MKLRFSYSGGFMRFAPAACLAVLGPALFAAALIPGSRPTPEPAFNHAGMKGQHRQDGKAKTAPLAVTVKTDLLRVAALVENSL